MSTTDALDSLTAAHKQRYITVSDRSQKAAKAIWLSSPTWWDSDVAKLAPRLVTVAKAGQLVIAGAETAYIARYQTVKFGTKYDPAPVARAEIDDTIDDPVDRFSQPAIALYSVLSRGGAFAVGVTASLNLLSNILMDSFTQARVVQQKASLAQTKRQMFIRTEGACCDYCVTVIGDGTMKYSTEDLAPLHLKCTCGVAPA